MDLSNIGSVTIFRNTADKHFPKIHLTLMKTKLRKELLPLTCLLQPLRPADTSKDLNSPQTWKNLQALLFPWWALFSLTGVFLFLSALEAMVCSLETFHFWVHLQMTIFKLKRIVAPVDQCFKKQTRFWLLFPRKVVGVSENRSSNFVRFHVQRDRPSHSQISPIIYANWRQNFSFPKPACRSWTFPKLRKAGATKPDRPILAHFSLIFGEMSTHSAQWYIQL